ncbi:MAG: 4Fe-4S dicluster domain-containing protein [Dehalococcoidales bacterium]
MSGNDVYEGLLTHLGFPGSDRLRAILEYLITPDEAEMVAALPGSQQEVADKTGVNINRVNETLDALFYKGVIFPRGDFRRREYFRFARSIGQFHDSTMATQELDPRRDTEFFKLWYDFDDHEMYPRFAEGIRQRPRVYSRIVPAYESIKDLPGVLPYENFPEILKAQELIATAPCSCRLCTDSVGELCDIHDEAHDFACLQFNRGADYVITRGSGKELTIEEALELNDRIEQSGLLHIWPNAAVMTGPKLSCQCCRDCCMDSVPADQAGIPISAVWEKSRYQAFVNQDDCDGCQDCVDRCLFDAIEMVRPDGSKKFKAVVDAEQCWGCGVCVLGCDQAALKMKTVRPPEHIPPAPTPAA